MKPELSEERLVGSFIDVDVRVRDLEIDAKWNNDNKEDDCW